MLFFDRRVCRAATHSEIITADNNLSPIHLAASEHEVRRHEVFKVILAVILRHASNLAGLMERAVVQHGINTLADGQATAISLAFDLICAAHLLSKCLTAAKFVHFGLPSS